MLNELIDRLAGLPARQRAAVSDRAAKALGGRRWIPNPGPQTRAYFSPADLLLYGGQGGGGKSDLLLGLGFEEHRRSLILRREYTQMGALLERAVQVNGSAAGMKRSSPPRLRTATGRLIEFGACRGPGDEQAWQGQPHDLIGFDEAAQFLEYQVRFLLGWNRPGDADADTGEGAQRCRAVLATNPPVSAEGEYLIGMFRPWLDPTHANPAEAEELRWFVTDPDGKDMEVRGPDDIREWDGKAYIPKSRTFIPAALSDNPYLIRTGYQATLDGLPEPLRSAVRDGNFMAARQDDAWQVIPSAWVQAAQRRWTPTPPDGVPMIAMGVDATGGGNDPLVIACRHDGWYAPLVAVPGKDIPMAAIGAHTAGLIVAHRRDGAAVVLDMGGGYGGPAYERLVDNGIAVTAHKGAEGSTARTADRKLGFVNKRSEVLWRFREALDPDQPGGSPVALPDDPALVADLTAPRFAITPRGIKAESKEDVVARLGRSPDRGDAVVMAWAGGARFAGPASQGRRRQVAPKVVISHETRRR